MVQSTLEMWHEMDRLVERVIAQFTSRSVGLTSDVKSQTPRKQAPQRTNSRFIGGATPTFTEAAYKHPSTANTEQGLCLRDSTIRSTRPAVYLPIFFEQECQKPLKKKRKKEEKKKTNAKMSWTFADDMF